MLQYLTYVLIYGVAILSLYAVDYFLGHGFLDMSQRILCKMLCYVRRTFRDEIKNVPETNINIPVVIIEILILGLTMTFLSKYKQFRGRDRIDVLLEQSKDMLRITNEFLEKWRLKNVLAAFISPKEPKETAISLQNVVLITIICPILKKLNEFPPLQANTKYPYLDETSQDIEQLKIEVPVLHMAIIDTLSTRRSKPERGDAGDTVSITDSPIISMTSLIDEDIIEPIAQENTDVENELKFTRRHLWKVTEEDADILDK